MTSYSSKLKGWATDRVIELYKSTETTGKTVDDVITDAEKLVAFCYEAQEEVEMLREQLAELEHNIALVDAVNMPPASNSNQVQ